MRSCWGELPVRRAVQTTISNWNSCIYGLHLIQSVYSHQIHIHRPAMPLPCGAGGAMAVKHSLILCCMMFHLGVAKPAFCIFLRLNPALIAV
ncbi:hypothetical protein IP70_12250 [alpha proteobacterium AAP38]|nr:hypothetical protein IP70_12250 [alpha proteobacterium AAP38]